MTKHKPYSTYKPSGVEWLGDVPKHWRTWRISHAFGQIGSGTTPDTKNLYFYSGDIPWVTTSELRENVITDTSEKLTEDALREHSALSLYPPGTLLIAMYGATIGRLGILGITACTNQACCALAKPRELDVKFCFYWLWMRRNEIVLLSSGGGQPNINQQKIYSIRIPAPPLQEQRAIAHFLDREITRIDTLITKKREMIDLLERKRAEIVTEAVTKGCDRNVSMKNSGISWIGEIPKHWLKIPIKYVCLSVRDGTHNPPAKVEGEYRLLSARNIQDGEFILRDDDRLMDADAFAELQRSYTVCKGDVVVAVVGATTGKSAVVGDLEKISVQRSIAILKPNHSMINSNYLNFWISSPALQHEIALTYSKYAAQGGIYLEDLANLTCVLPSLKEQTQILSLLDKSFTPLLKAEQKLLEQIDELQKYRQALITAAVTGKIDVREEIKSDRGVA